MIARSGWTAWAIVAAAAGLWLGVNPVSAQSPTNPNWPPSIIYPWGNGTVFGAAIQSGTTFRGFLPNGIPVVDPWNRQQVTPAVPSLQMLFANQYANWNTAPIWNPSLFPYWAMQGGLNGGFGNQGFMQPGAFGPGIQPPLQAEARIVGATPGLTFGPFTQVEPGRFSRLGPDIALNRTTGTILRPYSGVAFTNEGPFYRLPGSGTFTPWGAYIPGSGVFVNPFSGAAYNPQTGLILR